MSEGSGASLSNPILNGPYDPPAHHFEFGANGPTGRIEPGRRASMSFIPIARERKRGASGAGTGTGLQRELDLSLTGERADRNELINDLRREVELWRSRGYAHVTPVTRTLLEHWADPHRENRVLFGQREAVETAIYLAESAGREGNPDWRGPLRERNDEHNAGLPRLALKMATGSGKTVVMAMLVTWQAINKVMNPRDARFAKRFLVVTPGITIRDRLRVLQPGEPGNYYDLRELVPAQYQKALREAQVVVTNYHAFQPRDAKEIRGVHRTTRQILLGDAAGTTDDPFRESPDAVISRVLRGFTLPGGGRRKTAGSEIIVFNDEAHHCYRYNPEGSAKLTKDQKEANKEAGTWFTGLQWAMDRVGLKTVYDLSATPFYIAGSGYREGLIFPWTVCDYSLMDAIEAGIVKVPRTPVDDDAEDDRVTYLRLWDHLGRPGVLPKRRTATTLPGTWQIPAELQGALESLYRSYEKSYARWEELLKPLGEPPPVFIVVANNTVVSKLIYDWIAGGPSHDGEGNPVLTSDGTPVVKAGRLPLFTNIDSGRAVARPPTILIDSVQLESGEALTKEFLADAAEEIEAFKQEYRRRYPGADVDAIGEGDLLREVMNTVGKKGSLGEHVRCVVSVSMLTEGWDANTVSHILGVRAFGSQLLCEQVVGRGLRRRSYALNEEGRFEPEYANVYGIPFAFIPSDKNPPPVDPPKPATEVYSVPGREHLRIRFPRLVGYRLEVPDEVPWIDDDEDVNRFYVGKETVPTWTRSGGVAGDEEYDSLSASEKVRHQTVAYNVAKKLIKQHLRSGAGDVRLWLFPRLVRITRDFIERFVDVAPDYHNALRWAEVQAKLADAVYEAITWQNANRLPKIRAVLDPFDPEGDTGEVEFQTRKSTIVTEKSEISHVVLDGIDGNTWEAEMAAVCESIADVEAYVKNERLGFTIPYVHKGRSHQYVPDFLLKIRPREGDVDRYLIVEISGGQKSPGPTHTKADTARDSWCAAVNNHGGFGRWGYIEFTAIGDLMGQVKDAIAALYDDEPIIGDHDLLDYARADRPGRGAA
ncbi:BPTD_3080 family restriction endonuclease [Pseudactinotalea sp. HY158]|uniref:BPTD_3080 family restriction endonuclease n=1 Tax=Pseudactinotalea sp. HY158 TaxID=2654547 RepID=UPI00129D0E40|nr:DEAD/DEAH box helicase family protein [Pseudactinotalea sp. HY158]QGH68137.1 restriction endonuclease [Pseudactinotalea sp. HY158]